jgi:RNA polymerase sigma-70 factor, ECF subfamily
MPARDDVRIFEQASRRLLGLAYRILGSRADAEDAVQDTFIKWQDADHRAIENPAAWLTTACTRRCIDLLRSAHRTRVDYVGAWLPEPIQMSVDDNAENTLALTSSLSTAFLLMLERLTPKERAAYLLHEIFEMPYADMAKTLDIQEAACRKLISRARTNIDQAKVRHVTPVERQEELLSAFEAAVSGGGTDRLTALLSDDIRMIADSGGKVAAIGRVLQGKAEILDFIGMARKWWATCRWVETDLNGGRGVVLFSEGVPVTAMSFAYDEVGRATDIYVMRNPDKLARLTEAAVS